MRQTNGNPISTTSDPYRILSDEEDKQTRDNHVDYRSIVGKLLSLEKLTRPDVAYAVHQCASYSAKLKRNHTQSIKQIVRYILGTVNKGIILRPKPKPDIEIHVDAEFAGGWA